MNLGMHQNLCQGQTYLNKLRVPMLHLENHFIFWVGLERKNEKRDFCFYKYVK